MGKHVPCVLTAIALSLAARASFGEFVCGPKPKTCAIFLSAKVVFVGRVVFVDRSLGLVRIKVEESLKGLSKEAKEVWIDPYWDVEDPGPNYREGEEWLIIGSGLDIESWKRRHQVMNFDSSERQVYADTTRCPDAGSRRRNSSGMDPVLAELRAYRDGKSIPRGCRASRWIR
jgi:hypothetical protein